jgi:hypothetical protein
VRDIPTFFFRATLKENRVSTLRAAIELKGVFDQIQAAEKAGNLSPEDKKRLEEQAAEKGIQTLFKVRIYFLVPYKISFLLSYL